MTVPSGETYRRKVTGLLGSQDPLDVLERTPEAIAESMKSHSAKLMRTRPYPDKWTPTEIIGHLADAECVFGYRLRMVLWEDEPTLPGFDQDLWIAAQRHNDRETLELVEIFRSLRELNLPLWKGLTENDMRRGGVHGRRGRESLGEMLRITAGHDLLHLDQLRRYISAIIDAP